MRSSRLWTLRRWLNALDELQLGASRCLQDHGRLLDIDIAIVGVESGLQLAGENSSICPMWQPRFDPRAVMHRQAVA
jgi:hypothetical protein